MQYGPPLNPFVHEEMMPPDPHYGWQMYEHRWVPGYGWVPEIEWTPEYGWGLANEMTGLGLANEMTGLDVGDIAHYGQQIGQQIGQYGHEVAERARDFGRSFTTPVTGPISQGVSEAASRFGQSLRGLVPEFKVPDLSGLSETKAHADAAAASVDRAAREAEETAKHVRETARVAKIVLIGLGVLGGTAIALSMVK